MSRLSEINREIKYYTKQLINGEKNALYRILKLSKEREELLKPRKFRD